MRELKALLLVIVVVLAVLGGSTAVGGQATMASISGTAYTFNTRNVIAGATIRAVEFPDVSATTSADGSYTLSFPVGSEVTLYIEAAGHSSIRIQTFTLDDTHEGTTVVGANFQTPSIGVYDALRALVGSYLGTDPFADGCVIVTTVGMAELAGMPFDEFIRFAPHGVAGATATISPAVAQPIYFNASVIPDVNQLTTSNDGGVLWANVPPGTYELSAEHPTVEFTTARVRCEVGLVVNANPVWGLHAVPPTTTTTTTTTTETTTTTTSTSEPSGSSTTSVVTSTTGTSPATSTTGGATTTSMATGPLSTAPPITGAPGSSVGGAGAGAQPVGDRALSRTGTDAGSSVGAAVVLLVGGSLLLAVNRRRTHVGC